MTATTGDQQTTVTLRLFGDDLDPDAVTAALGCEPTMSHRRGDVLPNRAPAATGSWLLASAEKSRKPLEQQIDELLARLPGDLAVWKDLTARYRADVFCGVWTPHWNREIALSRQVLARLAERGLGVAFDIYYLHDD